MYTVVYMPDIENIKDIAEKILKRTASEEERAVFWQYMEAVKEDAVKETLFSAEVYYGLPEAAAPLEVEDRILHSILQHPSLPAKAPVVPLAKVAPRRLWMRYSAAACLLLVAGFFITRTTVRKQAPALAVLWDSIANPQLTPRMVTLTDHSTVWLNAHAVLYVRKDYATHRQVQLTGEGYFDIMPQAQNPFQVQTGNVTTTVLGTAFNIERIDSSCRVSLVKGKVRVTTGTGADTSSVLLQPGETAFAGELQTPLTTGNTAVQDIAAWTHGDLVLNQVSLQEALHKISNKYGITIKADEALLQGRDVSGTYSHGDTWDKVLTQVLFIYQLHYRKTADGNISITS